ncbi:MAG: hypothetical protein C0466_01260 [Candidatus Accumulibacter sp.]|nr:hypothetical protein [Accumulibacter sp.]
MTEFWWAYLALGAFAGFFAGLLGVGGGAIMVPILTSIFLAEGFPKSEVVHLALGTSMAAIIFTSISSLRAHHAHGAVLWKVVRGMTPGILFGTFGATFVAALLPTRPLTIFFACFISYVAVQMLLNIKPKPHRDLPGALGLGAVGLGIGGVSALVAIGGGSLSVPFMTWCNVKAHNAIGTSAALGLPIAVAGAIGYLVNGWGHPGLPPLTAGFIYLPALVLVTVVSTLVAPFGARLAHRLPVATLKRVFAGVLVALVVKMLWGVFA